MNTARKLITSALIISLLYGCSYDTDTDGTQDATGSSSRAAQNDFDSAKDKTDKIVEGITRAVNQLNERVETVASKELKSMLPVEIPGMTRVAYSASKKGIEGFSFSNADATFESDDDDGRLYLSVTDIGNIRGFATLGLDMLNIEVDEENQDGFQKTGTYKGFKSFQKHTRVGQGNATEIMVFVGDRFIVRAEADDVAWDLVQDVFDSLPIEKLPKLVN